MSLPGALHPAASVARRSLARALPVDGWLAAALALLSLLAHLPFRTHMLYAWDSVLYAYALDRFDVVAHHPQPPGYLFYVLAARAVRAGTGLPANDAYVWISALAAAAAVGLLYLAGRDLFGRAVGLIAAGLAATSVAFSVYAGVAYPYTTLAAGSALIGWLCWRLRYSQTPAWLVGLALGLLSGFRQDLLLLLGPLFVVSVGARPLGRLLGALLAVAGAALLWFVPSALLAGGVAVYLGALIGQASDVERATSAAAVGLAGLLSNARYLVRYTTNTLYLALVPLAFWVIRCLTTPAGRRDQRLWHLALWAALPVLVYTLVHLGEIGYVFSFMPPAWLAAAAGSSQLARWLSRGRPASSAAALVMATLPLAFNLWWFLGTSYPLSAAWLACKDRALARAVDVVTADYPPATTLLVTSGYYQHARYYLPAHPVWLHDPHREAELRRPVPPGVTRVVVFDWALTSAEHPRRHARPLDCGYTLYEYDVVLGDTIVVRPQQVTLVP